jgi:uncharacterized protein (TIGR00725 family)
LKSITVFGGSQTIPGQAAYQDALRLGHLLGERGCTVLTGGYMGTMEAVSRGAATTGAHVIGVTCQEIESWRPKRPNEWVKEERRYPTLLERLYALIDGCDVAMALPGGAGTLAEVSLMWNLLIIEAIPARQLILIGSTWQETMQVFMTNFHPFIPDTQLHLLKFATDVDDAVNILFQNSEDVLL